MPGRMLFGFIGSFPTATALYLALVFLQKVQFEPLWLIGAVVIDLLDDFLSQILPNY